MANDVFHQKTLTTTRDYVLEEDGVRISVKTRLSQDNFKIHYGAIAEERFETTTYSEQWLRLAVLFGLFAIIFGRSLPFGLAAILLYTVSLVFGVLFLLSWEKYVGYYADDGSLRFFANKPSKEELEAFMARVQERCSEYREVGPLASEGGRSAAAEIARLHSLKQAGAITEAEFDTLKQRAIGDSELPDARVIGFGGEDEG